MPDVLTETPPRPRRSVRGLVVDDAGRVLLVRRVPTDSLGAHWELPGGGQDEADPLDALARELQEETGLRLEADSAETLSEHALTTLRGPHLARIVRCRAGGDVRLSDEHDAHAWFAPDAPPAPLTALAVAALAA